MVLWRIATFFTFLAICVSSIGIGSLSPREAEDRSTIHAGEKEAHKLLQPADKTLKTMAIEFAEYQLSVDLFITTQTYVDMATLSISPRTTGGQVYYCYPFSALTDTAKHYNDLWWNVTSPQGFEAVMRVRCSQVSRSIGGVGLRASEFSVGQSIPKSHLPGPRQPVVLISEPYVRTRELQSSDRVVIFASVDEWEFLKRLNSQQIVNVVFNNQTVACSVSLNYLSNQQGVDSPTHSPYMLVGGSVLGLMTLAVVAIYVMRALRRKAQKRRENDEAAQERPVNMLQDDEAVQERPVNMLQDDEQNTGSEIPKKKQKAKKSLIIRRLLVKLNKKIAEGSKGTVVFEGAYNDRPVAVKRIFKNRYENWKEYEHLKRSDAHPNIVRCYGAESDERFHYLCLERCICTLEDLIHNKTFKEWKCEFYPYPSEELQTLMSDIICGLAHLHDIGYIHRDLKPDNILLTKINGKPVAKISDMGISKLVDVGMSSITKSGTGSGTLGWKAPEQNPRGPQTKAIDVFSLGCTLFYCVTGGKHPFGDTDWERNHNISHDHKKNMALVSVFPEVDDLISRLLDPIPELRPKAPNIQHHPMLWDNQMRCLFLQAAGNRVRVAKYKKETALLAALDATQAQVSEGQSWDKRVDPVLIADMKEKGSYNFNSIADLLRAIRNYAIHFRELTPPCQTVFVLPQPVESYFTKEFSSLLIEVYKVLSQQCGEEDEFQAFFKFF